mgnify:FL=1
MSKELGREPGKGLLAGMLHLSGRNRIEHLEFGYDQSPLQLVESRS